MKKHLRVFFVALFAMVMCLFALVGCGDKKKLTPPDISGPTALSLYEGYEATSTEPFTVTGDEAVVTKTSGDEKIAWNDETKRLDIEEGLAVGTYEVVLTASNGDAETDKTATFTLTVQALVPPSIDGPKSMTLTEGYTKTSTEAYTVAGTNAEVSIINDTSNGKMTWNDAEKKIDIAAGLQTGTYMVRLQVSNGKPAQNVTLDFTLTVRRLPHIEGPASMDVLEGYEATHSETFTISGVGVTVSKTNGNENITWNNTTKQLDIAEGLEVGTYEVELTASNGTAAENATFTFTLNVKKVYTVTGTYDYASGTLAGGKYTVENDTVTISAGDYEATVESNSAEGGTYTVHVPEGTHDVTLSSKYFRSVTVNVEVTEGEESLTGPTATFSIPKLTGEEGTEGKITKVEGGYDLASLGNPTGKTGRFYTLAENVSGNFIVKYEVTLQGTATFSVPMFFVKAGDGDQWVGLYVWYRQDKGDTPYVRMAVGTNVGRGINPASGAMKGEAVNGAQPMKMTVAFRDGTYYILAEYTGTDAQPKTLYAKLDNTVTLQYGEATDSDGNPSVNKTDFYGTKVSRTLAFSAAGDIGHITNISYSLGDVGDIIDSTFFRTVTVDTVENGEVKLNGGNITSGNKVFIGTEITVTVTPTSGYQVKKFEVGGVDKLGEIGSGSYTFTVTEDVTITVEFESVPIYTLTGTYEYTSGTLEGGVYKNDSDKVKVMVGAYEATVNTADRKYTVSVPAGTYEVTLTSKYFRDVVLTGVQVTEDGGTAEKATFSKVKLTGEAGTEGKITETTDGYDLTGNSGTGTFYTFAENVKGNFIVSFDMAVTGPNFFSTPMLFFNADDTQWVGLSLVAINGNNSALSRLVMLLGTDISKGINPQRGGANIEGPKVDATQPIRTTIAFKDGTYYVYASYMSLAETEKPSETVTIYAEVNSSTTYNNGSPSGSINKDKFFGTNVTRKLAFSALQDTGRITDISYKFGNVDAEIESTFFRTVTVDVVDKTEHGTVTLNGGAIAASKDGTNVLVGTQIAVKVTPNGGYQVKTFEVDNADKADELQEGVYTFTVTKDTEIRVEFEEIQVPIYTLTGTYEYKSGTLEGGVYKNTNDTVTVKVGSYETTGKDGSYSVDVPAGTYEVTLTSKYFRDVVKKQDVQVTQDGKNTVDTATFTLPKLTGASASEELDNGYKLNAGPNGPVVTLLENVTGSFVVKYETKVTGSNSFTLPMFAIKTNTAEWIGLYVWCSKASANVAPFVRMAIGSNWSSAVNPNKQGMKGTTAVDFEKPIKMTIAFKAGVYYLLAEYTDTNTVIKTLYAELDTNIVLQWGGSINKTLFYGTNVTRQLGFHAMQDPGQITNISYGLGDDAVTAAIAAMDGENATDKYPLSAAAAVSASAPVALPARKENY